MSPAPPPSVQVGGTIITAGDLLVGQYLRRVLRLPEPSRTRAWIATMFEADPEGEIEQVALWGMYRMQFEPHQGEDAGVPIPPLAAATDVITVMETVFRPDSYIGPDGMKRYVIRGLKLRPSMERDAVLDDMFRAPDVASVQSTAGGTPSATHQAHHNSHNNSSSSGLIASMNHQSTHAHHSAPPLLAGARSADLLDEVDVVKIVHFPEPYRTRLWIASLFEPDPTSNAGPGGGGVEQVTLWQLYQKQFTYYVQEGTLGDKPVPQLAPATEVIKAVQDVFPEGRVVVRLEDGKTHYMIVGIKLRPSPGRSPALKNLLTITGRLSGTSSNGPTAQTPQPDPVTAQLVSQVETLVKTVDDLQSVVKQQELIIKQELAWNAARQANLRLTEVTAVLRPLSSALPTMAPSYPLDFPKTVDEANKLSYVQSVGLLERYGQTHLIHENSEEKTRDALLEFIGCISLSCTSTAATPAVTSMV